MISITLTGRVSLVSKSKTLSYYDLKFVTTAKRYNSGTFFLDKIRAPVTFETGPNPGACGRVCDSWVLRQ